MAGFWQQLKALLIRNILLKKRNKIQLFQEILFPIYFVGILAMIRALWNPKPIEAATFPVLGLNDSGFGEPFSDGKFILVVPDDAQTQARMQEVMNQLPGNSKLSMFSSIKEAETWYHDHSDQVVAGVIFNNSDPNSYILRAGYDDLPPSDKNFTINRGACQDDNGTSTDVRCQANKYMTSGLAQLQLAVENVLLKDLNVQPDPKTRNVQVQFMDMEEYLPDSNGVQAMSSIYLVMSFSFLATFLSVNIVAEKEKKIKDGMMMMGLRTSAFWLSWTLIYMALIIISTAMMVIIIVASKFIQKSNIFILYITFLLYGTSFIGLAFMITPFFNRAKVAGAVTGISTIVVSCLYFAVSQTRDTYSYDSNVPAAVQWLMCLLSPIAFATFIDQGLFLDIRLDGFGFDDSITFGKFPLYAPIVMLLVDTVLYALLTVYFDHVIPGEYGVRYHPLYFLKRSYWCRSREPGETSRLMASSSPHTGLSQAADVEPVPRNMDDKVAMRISSLTKTFKASGKVTTAVDDFSLDVYESQITCLLGHNGAGKSTLMNMLTGVLPPTSGSATIMGLHITNSDDLEEIRTMCGICPQHNILYDNLSCMEHLQLFANIKGVQGHLVDRMAEQALRDVDLESQRDTFASDLSGGQKRKLSVAIALIGDPKLIFLDEPTAGMDPFSRRHLWSLLTQRKQGRVVLLTTHFMDEADILADRKAFIRKGKLRCCGSSLFLKNKFGIGYHLTMVVSPDCRVDKVTSMLQSVVPSTEHERSHGKELAYTVPLKDVSQFSTLFGELDEKAEGLGIKNYGVSMTTLEEVFLKLEADEEADEENGEINEGYSSNHDDISIDLRTPLPTDQDFDKPTVRDGSLAKQRFFALLKIRFLLLSRNYKALVFQVFLPVVMVVAGILLADISEVKPAGYPQTLHLDLNNLTEAASTAPQNITRPPFLVFDAINSPDSGDVIAEWKTQYMVDNYTAGSKNTSAIAPHFVGVQMDSLAGKVLMDFVALYNYTAVHAIPVAIHMASQSMLAMSNISTTISGYVLPWPQRKSIEYNPGAYAAAMLVGMAFMFVIPGLSAEIVQDREKKLRGQLRISGVNFNIYWGSIYLCDLLIYLLPAVAIIIIVFAMQIPGLTNGGAVGALVLLFITNIPFNIVMGLVISFVFDKTETCVAYLPLLLMFAMLIPYVIVSLVDMITNSVVAIVIHYLACVACPPYLVAGGFYFVQRVYMVAALNGDDVSPGDYFDFGNHVLITIIMPVVHFIWMYCLLRGLDVWKTGGQIKEAFPCTAQSVETAPSVNNDTIEHEDDDVGTERARIENLHSHDNRTNIASHGLNDLHTKEPVAYTSQLRKVFVKRTQNKRICSSGELKMKIAVRNLSIGVDRGEVLGLLGPNGAGKSTALNMMIAETGPTCGKVVVSGHNIRSNMLSVLESLGYCPQHDALWDTITLEEHIKCFATIKGVDPRHLDEVVDYYIRSLKLEEHRNKHSKKLSGGTKRKLSYIMSILGSPHLVLLDEPSTGMDPQSKRFLWDTISTSFSNTDRGAILTTHYMEEADALCGRVAIMVNGQLQCIGSTQHLKGKYGSGYILEVKLGNHEPSEVESLMDNLESHLKELFPGLDTTERFMERAQYAIPKQDVKSLGRTFASLESCKNTHRLEEYSFSQSSLEQVFLHFAKQQVEEGEEGARTNAPLLTPQVSRTEQGASPAVYRL